MALGKRGWSKVSAIIYLAISLLVIYVAIKTIPPYMDYYSMEDEVVNELHLFSINSSASILDDLQKKARELELPISPEDIKVDYGDNSINIQMKWVQTVDYGYGIKRDYPFEINDGAKRSIN